MKKISITKNLFSYRLFFTNKHSFNPFLNLTALHKVKLIPEIKVNTITKVLKNPCNVERDLFKLNIRSLNKYIHTLIF